jgi:hypothetical protein
MADENIIYQTNLFLYDLNNRAKEHWFKTDEKWVLVLATAGEKTAVEKMYFPVVSLEGSSSAISAIAERVDARLNPLKQVSYPVIKGNDPVWLLAYSPLRLRN